MNSHISDPHRIFSVDSPQKHPGSYSPPEAQNPGPLCDPFCGGGPPLGPSQLSPLKVSIVVLFYCQQLKSSI